ncbi:glycosyltransferase [Paenibacillus albicereus]|uniref:Glycosyltransferase n=1 Tax=Paenibacillus albicereus TaxID=2726185 RepID=A0A6H2H1W9_9BACL|nr:glycosyltransferase [Paenibacillus albicereus]QJC53338.1 glycosyltransferase [Paenibacillus albicereus]
MKILHVIANLAPRYGGPAKAGMEMSAALAARGHDVTIFTTNQDGDGVLEVPTDRIIRKNGVDVRYFPVVQPKFWRTSPAMAAALKKEIPNFDIVHIHSLYLFHGMAAGHYARKHGVPYIVRPHGTLDPVMYARHRYRKKIMETLFEDRNIRLADALHYTTEEELLLAEPYVHGSPGFVVPNGVNSSDYRELPPKGTFRSRYKLLEGKKMLLFFSRINFKKGLDVLVEAFREIHRRHPDTVLVLTGPDDENYGQKVREWLKAASLSEFAIFTGMLTGADKLAVLRDADLFLLPSYSENFGIAVVEAMACGVPVVISDKVNIWREVVAEGAGLATPVDPAQVADAASRLLDDPELREQMGERGRAMVSQYYEWSQVAAQLEQEYRQLAGEAGTAGSGSSARAGLTWGS